MKNFLMCDIHVLHIYNILTHVDNFFDIATQYIFTEINMMLKC